MKIRCCCSLILSSDTVPIGEELRSLDSHRILSRAKNNEIYLHMCAGIDFVYAATLVQHWYWYCSWFHFFDGRGFIYSSTLVQAVVLFVLPPLCSIGIDIVPDSIFIADMGFICSSTLVQAVVLSVLPPLLRIGIDSVRDSTLIRYEFYLFFHPCAGSGFISTAPFVQNWYGIVRDSILHSSSGFIYAATLVQVWVLFIQPLLCHGLPPKPIWSCPNLSKKNLNDTSCSPNIHPNSDETRVPKVALTV